MKHILLNNLGSKHNLVMKFSQFIQYYKSNFLSKNYMKIVAWELVPGPFYFSWNSPWNGIQESQSAGLDKFW